jgi:DNA-binding NarL/FixJ family response regulator
MMMNLQATPESQAIPETKIIKVAIVEDHDAIREGIGFLINSTAGYELVGKFGSMEEALKNLPKNLPDVILFDIGLPGMSGIEGARILKDRYPEMSLVALTIYSDDDRIFEAICAGASGYLLKKTPPARLIEGLKEAVAGGAPMSPEIAGRVITLFRKFSPPEKSDYKLTPHETRLLKMLVDGYNYKTAALELGSSINTIGTHMQSIYRKLQVHSKSEAVAKALQERLI